MRLKPLVFTLAFAAACDSSSDVKVQSTSYVLSRVDDRIVPAELIRNSTATTTSTATIVRGSLVFATADSARFTLLSESRSINTAGEQTAAQEVCNTIMVGYRQSGSRVFLDLEIPPQAPSQGLPPGFSMHDTLVVNGSVLTGAHTLKFAVTSLLNRRVLVEYRQGATFGSPCAAL